MDIASDFLPVHSIQNLGKATSFLQGCGSWFDRLTMIILSQSKNHPELVEGRQAHHDHRELVEGSS